MPRATQHSRKRPWKPSCFGREDIPMPTDARKLERGINIFIDDDPPITGARIKVIGIGGGGGNGGAPIIASLATELDCLTVAVVTKPFHFEGRRRMQQAEHGLREVRECVDTVITIPNEGLLHTVQKDSSLADSFRVADDVLRQAVQGISDLITVPGLINLDFADVKSIMQGMGMALMGAGRARGENRAIEATQQAISSPLLEEATIQG